MIIMHVLVQLVENGYVVGVYRFKVKEEKMNELEESIFRSQRRIKELKESLEKEEKLLHSYIGTKQPTFKELYSDFEKYCTFQEVENQEYTNILGGDGRSAPRDETKKGKVLNVIRKKGVFLSKDQIEVIGEYCKRVYVYNHIRFL